ncbi:MAG: pantetheine-phosphate adenylyltransferase, partial [Clostridiales bacterium]|nr:pantetheine-phosphate adenylyltransferase [Clostridiales bacterium]
MKAIFAGTFDPFTLGHKNIVERAVKLFDEVIIAVAEDTGKVPAPLKVRTEIAKAAVSDMVGVTVESFSGLLTDYVKAKGDCTLVRGMRNSVDLEYERDITNVYKSLCGVESVFLITDGRLSHVSSTVVRTVASLGGDISSYVVPRTLNLINEIYGKRR